MKKFLLSGVALAALLGTPALAADMPLKAPPLPPPVWSWTGCYLGGHAGGAWAHDDLTDVGIGGVSFAAAGKAGQTFPLRTSDLFFGVHVGCNYQFSAIVVGIEGDGGMMDLHGAVLDPGTASSTMVGISSGAYGDVTGRIGVAFGDALIYAKGGWAAYGGRETFSTTAPFTVGTGVNLFQGWTAGGGIEYHLGGPWTAKIEYLHYDFGTQTFFLTPVAWPFAEKLTVDTVEVGFNVKFDWAPH